MLFHLNSLDCTKILNWTDRIPTVIINDRIPNRQILLKLNEKLNLVTRLLNQIVRRDDYQTAVWHELLTIKFDAVVDWFYAVSLVSRIWSFLQVFPRNKQKLFMCTVLMRFVSGSSQWKMIIVSNRAHYFCLTEKTSSQTLLLSLRMIHIKRFFLNTLSIFFTSLYWGYVCL